MSYHIRSTWYRRSVLIGILYPFWIDRDIMLHISSNNCTIVSWGDMQLVPFIGITVLYVCRGRYDLCGMFQFSVIELWSNNMHSHTISLLLLFRPVRVLFESTANKSDNRDRLLLSAWGARASWCISQSTSIECLPLSHARVISIHVLGVIKLVHTFGTTCFTANPSRWCFLWENSRPWLTANILRDLSCQQILTVGGC